MTDEKAVEYQQVAALLVDQIELAELAARRSKDPMGHLEDLKKYCDRIISDKAYREEMYRLGCMLSTLPSKETVYKAVMANAKRINEEADNKTL